MPTTRSQSRRLGNATSPLPDGPVHGQDQTARVALPVKQERSTTPPLFDAPAITINPAHGASHGRTRSKTLVSGPPRALVASDSSVIGTRSRNAPADDDSIRGLLRLVILIGATLVLYIITFVLASSDPEFTAPVRLRLEAHAARKSFLQPFPVPFSTPATTTPFVLAGLEASVPSIPVVDTATSPLSSVVAPIFFSKAVSPIKVSSLVSSASVAICTGYKGITDAGVSTTMVCPDIPSAFIVSCSKRQVGDDDRRSILPDNGATASLDLPKIVAGMMLVICKAHDPKERVLPTCNLTRPDNYDSTVPGPVMGVITPSVIIALEVQRVWNASVTNIENTETMTSREVISGMYRIVRMAVVLVIAAFTARSVVAVAIVIRPYKAGNQTGDVEAVRNAPLPATSTNVEFTDPTKNNAVSLKPDTVLLAEVYVKVVKDSCPLSIPTNDMLALPLEPVSPSLADVYKTILLCADHNPRELASLSRRLTAYCEKLRATKEAAECSVAAAVDLVIKEGVKENETIKTTSAEQVPALTNFDSTTSLASIGNATLVNEECEHINLSEQEENDLVMQTKEDDNLCEATAILANEESKAVTEDQSVEQRDEDSMQYDTVPTPNATTLSSATASITVSPSVSVISPIDVDTKQPSKEATVDNTGSHGNAWDSAIDSMFDNEDVAWQVASHRRSIPSKPSQARTSSSKPPSQPQAPPSKPPSQPRASSSNPPSQPRASSSSLTATVKKPKAQRPRYVEASEPAKIMRGLGYSLSNVKSATMTIRFVPAPVRVEAQSKAIEEPAVEVTAVEEIAVQESVIEEPIVEEPTVQEPTIQETTVEESVVQESVVEEPTAQELVFEEPVVEEAIIEESAIEEVLVEELAVGEIVVEEPVIKEAAVVDKQSIMEPDPFSWGDEEVPALLYPVLALQNLTPVPVLILPTPSSPSSWRSSMCSSSTLMSNSSQPSEPPTLLPSLAESEPTPSAAPSSDNPGLEHRPKTAEERMAKHKARKEARQARALDRITCQMKVSLEFLEVAKAGAKAEPTPAAVEAEVNAEPELVVIPEPAVIPEPVVISEPTLARLTIGERMKRATAARVEAERQKNEAMCLALAEEAARAMAVAEAASAPRAKVRRVRNPAVEWLKTSVEERAAEKKAGPSSRSIAWASR